MKLACLILMLAVTSAAGGPASAAGRQFYKCALLEGQSFENLHTWAAEWRVAADAAGLSDYKSTILIPVGNKDMEPGTYMWEAAAPSADRFSAVDQWFARSEEAKAFQVRFAKIASCQQPTNWRVAD